jgi:hypothetical protein
MKGLLQKGNPVSGINIQERTSKTHTGKEYKKLKH